MTTFSQWWTAFNKSKKINAQYYVCGTEQVLIDEVVDTVTSNYEVSEWNLQKLVVGLHSEEHIWETLFSASVDGKPALTIVNGAEGLSNKNLIPELIVSKSPQHVVIFVSKEEKIERVPVENEVGETKFVLPDYFDGFEKKGKVIECSAFTQSTAKTAVAWVKTKVDAKDGVMVHLLNESNGDLRLVRDVIHKLRWIGEQATMRSVSVLLHNEPADTFSDALISNDKKTAMQALSKIPSSEYLQLIGHLDAQVDLAGRVHDMLVKRKTVAEIMRESGSQAFLVPAISKVAKHYTRDRRMLIRHILAETDRRIRRGNQTGALESLVVLW